MALTAHRGALILALAPAPSQEVWDRMSPEERDRVVAMLPIVNKQDAEERVKAEAARAEAEAARANVEAARAETLQQRRTEAEARIAKLQRKG